MIKVQAIKADNGHWYIVPNDEYEEFYLDHEKESMVDSGLFDDKYSKYKVGSHPNLTQLYVKEEDLLNES